jgi:hypothetical protein
MYGRFMLECVLDRQFHYIHHSLDRIAAAYRTFRHRVHPSSPQFPQWEPDLQNAPSTARVG